MHRSSWAEPQQHILKGSQISSFLSVLVVSECVCRVVVILLVKISCTGSLSAKCKQVVPCTLITKSYLVEKKVTGPYPCGEGYFVLAVNMPLKLCEFLS